MRLSFFEAGKVFVLWYMYLGVGIMCLISAFYIAGNIPEGSNLLYIAYVLGAVGVFITGHAWYGWREKNKKKKFWEAED